MKLTGITDEVLNAYDGVADYARDVFNPTLRLGVTGLARSGKTVFITALIHNLVHGGRLPAFSAMAEGRIKRAWLQPQPDDNIPRFAYEDHLEALTGDDRHWPQSTKRISQLRITIEYEPEGWLSRTLSRGRLNIDIIDYPGEWLLDLPLLNQTYAEWSHNALDLSDEPVRKPLAKKWRKFTAALKAHDDEDELTAQKASTLFTEYLRACRDERVSLSTVPPGRFLMPGDMEGSPALTFAPIEVEPDATIPKGSMAAMMERRFEAYKTHVIKPFFRNHFARLDRQIVLVDALSALNAGPEAMNDLQRALGDILKCFRPGKNSWLSSILARRIDKILFAATKADHLHHTNHDRLEAIIDALTQKAALRAKTAGAEISALAMASLRATNEANVTQKGEKLGCITGIPIKGEKLDGDVFDGLEELAIFPGDLPKNASKAFNPKSTGGEELRFIRFRPPENPENGSQVLPHIRLDRAMEFLFGDRLA